MQEIGKCNSYLVLVEKTTLMIAQEVTLVCEKNIYIYSLCEGELYLEVGNT